MAYINLCLHVYSWWLAKINMCILLLAVTCPLFGSNGMHAVSSILITIDYYFETVCLHILHSAVLEKIRDINTQAKIIFESIKC